MIRTPSKFNRNAKRQRTTYKARPKASPRRPLPGRLVDVGRNPFPFLLKNQLTYCEQATITVASGAYNYAQFSCNNLYDPRTAVGGGQPRYYDQLSAIYNHWTVVTSFIEVSLIKGTTSATGLTWGVYVDDDAATVAANISDLMEMKGARYSTQNTHNDPARLRIGWSAATTFGNPTPWRDPELQGTSGAGPAEQCNFTIGINDVALASATYTFNVKVTYNVVWDEFKYVAQS